MNYNLGLLNYYRYQPDGNEEARKLFNQASRTPNARLKGLAKTGLARCFCQDYHRFGRETPSVLNEARELAGEAIALLEQARSEAGKKHAHLIKLDLARAYACRAFAYHVTEQPDDIEKGKADYLNVIDQTHPDVPTYVYNNLGYILMARAGRFTPADDKASYGEAESYLEKALEQTPRHKFALANLGNVERLIGRHENAISRYQEAVTIDPDYTNGWNELAWAYLAHGQAAEAQEAHERALGLSRSDSQLSEVKELYARALHSIGLHEEALRTAKEAITLNADNSTLVAWLNEIE